MLLIILNSKKTKNNKKAFSPIFFSEDEQNSYRADDLFEKAIYQPIIVNLPAQVAPLVKGWIEKNELIELGKAVGVSWSK
ncbi:MAG: hypothetical protein F6K10_24815 [Moorea sp. SIO2B7]|nr:hypothetical protein [Moorena sp. SIO2B7]